MQNNKIFLQNLGNLVETQHASYFNFLYKGISEELKIFPNPLITQIKFPTRSLKTEESIALYLLIDNIYYQGPNNNTEICLQKGLTYSLSAFLSTQYSYEYDPKKDDRLLEIKLNLKRIIINQKLFLCEIPLITDQGSFIINGYEKVVINQLIRSPGIYFQKNFSSSKKVIYSALLISDKGLWTSMFLDEKNNKDIIYLSLSDNRNINNYDQVKLNFSLLELLSAFGLTDKEFLDSLKNLSFLENLDFFHNFSSLSSIQKDRIDSLLYLKEKAYNQSTGIFSVGKLGRYNLNKKLKLNLPANMTYLTIFDLIETINNLFELKYSQKISDDIDHLKHKRIRSVGHLLQNQIKIGLAKVRKQIFRLLEEREEAFLFLADDSSINSERFTLDSRYISQTLKDFFITSQLAQFMDQINPLSELTHKRRVSVFGPNGLKRDHVNLVVRDIHTSQYARLCPIETPEGSNAGLVTSLSMYAKLSPLGNLETPYFVINRNKLLNTKKVLYINVEQEDSLPIALADFAIDNKKLFKTELLSTKLGSLFYQEKLKNINLSSVSSNQLISIATSLIPFIEHDDANRALMGSNMQRQAVPLIYSQKPFIGTGYEANVVFNSETIIKNYSEGVVLYVSSKYIVIQDNFNQLICYPLKKYKRSNQKTVLTQKAIVWPKEKVFSGQILADGASTSDGELALGTNLTIAYMPWEGYNFEDAIVISNKLVINDLLSSIHIEEYETYLHYSANQQETLTNKYNERSHFSNSNLNSNGIIKIGSFVRQGDILVGKISAIKENEVTRLIQALYKTSKTLVKDDSLRVTKKSGGRVISVRIFYGGKIDNSALKLRIVIHVAQKRKIKVGDKLSGRHGNKGIVSRILPYEDMPYLPNGMPVDILFNPLGVPSRMNVGQIFECLLGLASDHLGMRFYVGAFDEVYGENASRILINQKLKQAALTTKTSWLYNLMGLGKVLLRDGRTGEFFDNPITIGKSYILKLIHLVEDKIHSRSIGPYTKILEQPLAGKSKQGGQRFGEMEVWALEAYGVANTLQELLTIKSDDIDGRNDMYQSIILEEKNEKRVIANPSIPEAFLTLIRELNALGLSFDFFKIIEKPQSSQILNMFSDIEKRLKLRNLLKHEQVYNLKKLKINSSV